MVFWLIFSIVGVQFFGGRFYKCVDSQGERLPISIVQNRTDCDRLGYRWINSNINFDNAGNGFIALFQVVSLSFCVEPGPWSICIHVQTTKTPWDLPKDSLSLRTTPQTRKLTQLPEDFPKISPSLLVFFTDWNRQPSSQEIFQGSNISLRDFPRTSTDSPVPWEIYPSISLVFGAFRRTQTTQFLYQKV